MQHSINITGRKDNLPTESCPRWFLRLRLFAFAGQILLLFLAISYFEVSLPWLPIALVLALVPLSHFLFVLWAEKIRPIDFWPKMFLILDTLILSIVLYLSGGPANPFSIVYLVHVVLAAVILGKTWTWIITLLSTVCFALLFMQPRSMHDLHGSGDSSALSLHLYGMLFSYVLVAGVIAYFLLRILEELKVKQAALTQLKLSQEKLISLTTVSASAAHELATPLATMQVIVHELSRHCTGKVQVETEAIGDDLSTLETEIARCRRILDEMSAQCGDVSGEMPDWYTLGEIKDSLEKSLCTMGLGIECSVGSCGDKVRIQKGPALVALKELIKNGCEANRAAKSPDRLKVSLSCRTDRFCAQISDKGHGIAAANLPKMGQPFFTTKSAGMGLGVYIANLVAEKLSGSLRFSSSAAGTTAYFEIPCNASPIKKAA